MQADFEIARWDHFEIDVRRRLLLSSGKPVKLHAVAFDLLTYLVACHEAPVSRDDILTNVWKGRTVDQGNVAVQLSAVRAALKQSGADQPLILVLPGPRYRFIGDVTFAPAPAATLPAATPPELLPLPPTPNEPLAVPPPRRRIGIATTGSIAALAALLLAGTMLYRNRTPAAPDIPRLSMVVLPFRYQGADQTQHYLADGITDDLTIDLAHIPASTVIARESAEAVKNEAPQQIRRDLRVEYAITGTLTPEDASYHVDTTLIDTATGTYLGTDRFDVARGHIGEARDAIVRRIAGRLHVQLDQLESARSLHDRPHNPDALDLFFRARAELDIDDAEGLFKAQKLLESAVALQPDFADAQAELGWVLLRKVQTIDDDKDEEKDWIKANPIIQETLSLAPQNSKAIASMARELFIKGRYREAQAAAQNALHIEPSSLEANWVLANCAWMLGQLDAEKLYLGEILKLNPEGIDTKRVYFLLGIIHLLENRPSDAIDLLLKSIAGDPPPQPGEQSMGRAERARAWLIAAYGMNNDRRSASEQYRDYNNVWPNRSVWRFGAYLPAPISSMPIVARVFESLHLAGMPQFVDQTTSAPAQSQDCGSDVFSPTPLQLEGVTVLDTKALVELVHKQPSPLILDLGQGVATVPGALWFDPAGPVETSTEFVQRTISSLPLAATKIHVVIMGDSPFGCVAYNAAKDLATKRLADVYWYRGGEEAWASFGQHSLDVRPR